jgi:NarL family two-component system sensor histidine kinase YdfH
LLLGLVYAGLAMVLLFVLVGRNDFGAAVSNLLVNGVFIVLFMVVLNQQFTEREKAQELAERLESANARLAANAARIEALTLQNERQRMARELHDTLAQGLSGLVLQLEAVKAHLASQHTERASAIVDQALARARGTLAESRAAIDDLRLAPADLADRVREKVDRFAGATGIRCEVDLAVQENQLSAAVADHAVSILSEALANVARHAQADQVKIRFVLEREELELEVLDNGKGFDVNGQSSTGHYGLLGMRERARLTGGLLAIESTPQNGTRVRFTVKNSHGGQRP